MTNQDLIKSKDNQVESSEHTRSAVQTVIPAVDIYETDENLTLMADLPGVTHEGLDIQLDNGLLTIRGKVGSAQKGKHLLQEFSSADYYRQFKLSDRIAAEKTTAELDSGVLKLIIPKAETAKPRKVEIRH